MSLTTVSTQNSDTTSTRTSLTHLISLADQTLETLSFLQPKNSNFTTCPHNPNHLMPQHSLFLHTLHCPFPISDNPSSLLSSLHYPNTLNLKKPIQPSQSTDLCVPLKGYFSEFGSSFFYKDCPSVVELRSLDFCNRDCVLPGFLYVECADFVSRFNDAGFSGNEFRIIASELWRVKCEVGSWVDFPVVCSYSVFCAVLRLNLISESDLRRWIIVGSPRFGVVIDVFMRDHISVLFGICLKAIRKEALDLVNCVRSTSSSSVKCPVLVQVLMWVTSQLSILYVEVNAKHFVIQVFRQCVLQAANEALLAPAAEFCLMRGGVSTGDSKDMKIDKFSEDGAQDKVGDKGSNLDDVVIFVYQVVAAVAALHERFLLELKIKELRNHHPQTKYQRMVEYDNLTKKAEDERKGRPNYRVIVDHDGLLRRRSSDQESNKIKTREELLAEERDYKRRRMSYRGKKVKRTTIQVTRDIIDEYMEEIRESGGIGCFDKGDVGEDFSTSSDKNLKPRDFAVYDFERHRQGQDHRHRREPLEYSTVTSLDGNDREHSLGSPRRHRSYSLLHGKGSIKSDQDDFEFKSTGKKSDVESSTKPSYKDGHKSHSMDRNENRSSHAKAKNAFEDRYNPAESLNADEDEVYFRYSDANT